MGRPHSRCSDIRATKAVAAYHFGRHRYKTCSAARSDTPVLNSAVNREPDGNIAESQPIDDGALTDG